VKTNEPIQEPDYIYAELTETHVSKGPDGKVIIEYLFVDQEGNSFFINKNNCCYSDGTPWDPLGFYRGFRVRREGFGAWMPAPVEQPPKREEPPVFKDEHVSHEEKVEESLSEIAALLTDIYRLLDQRL
jgi:hypothetical protein